MAFNPSPKVAAARDMAEKFDKRAVIVLMIGMDNDGGTTLEYASYGKTKDECDFTKVLAGRAYEHLAEDIANAAVLVGAIREE